MKCNLKVLQAVHNGYYCTHTYHSVKLKQWDVDKLTWLTFFDRWKNVTSCGPGLFTSVLFTDIHNKVLWCLFLVLASDLQLNRCGTQLAVPRHLRRGYHWVGKRVLQDHRSTLHHLWLWNIDLKSFSSLWSLHLYPVRRRARRCPGRRRSRARGPQWRRDTGYSKGISWTWKGDISLISA